jgi:hypothetical protein
MKEKAALQVRLSEADHREIINNLEKHDANIKKLEEQRKQILERGINFTYTPELPIEHHAPRGMQFSRGDQSDRLYPSQLTPNSYESNARKRRRHEDSQSPSSGISSSVSPDLSIGMSTASSSSIASPSPLG